MGGQGAAAPASALLAAPGVHVGCAGQAGEGRQAGAAHVRWGLAQHGIHHAPLTVLWLQQLTGQVGGHAPQSVQGGQGEVRVVC